LWARRKDLLVYPPVKVELGAGREVEVALSLNHRGARVSGQVRAGEGYALGPDSRVLLLSRSPLAFPSHVRVPTAEIAPDHTFVVRALLPGHYEISVRDGTRALQVVQGPRDVEIPIEPDSTVSLPEPVVVKPQSSSE
jgi:hypothetical protein